MAKKRIDLDKRNRSIASTVEYFALEMGREQINLHDIRRTAEKLDISENIVKRALQSQGIEWTTETASVANVTNTNIFPVVAAILRGETLESAGKAGGVTKQWASSIRKSMLEHNIFGAAETYVINTSILNKPLTEDPNEDE